MAESSFLSESTLVTESSAVSESSIFRSLIAMRIVSVLSSSTNAVGPIRPVTLTLVSGRSNHRLGAAGHGSPVTTRSVSLGYAAGPMSVAYRAGDNGTIVSGGGGGT